MKKIFLLAATVLLLSGCASNSSHEGMVYRDGSWYSPAADGQGDYYTASPRPYYGTAYDYPYDFGIGIVPWGGYCSVAYRWCTSYWPYYDPYLYQPWVYYQNHPRHGRRRPVSDIVDVEADSEGLPLPRSSDARGRARSDPWEDRPARAPRSGGGRHRRGNVGNGELGGDG